ncbi:DUF4267 domain-containing protein [Paenibacillus sp. CGMCC 1.16610]|uniref:DUF4267 domain-containing protein n=1 Tax=Paenibacillus anseongense TaxID=2682845 RepID=A0ABW9U540_9BACL|nr:MULTISPECIES: DUF4267 domain-containing protein [Paenibacillus]MBA2938623.1 DUF4267 domain-containing protein [Paenibacillus sp. CGMCC 1.16610]MVQ34586.1 DUF4267 domain-containing protein [Paenibacillus anseongense]
MSTSNWGLKSVSFWLVGVVTLLMLFLGAKGFMTPEAAIRDFGLPLHDVTDKYLVHIKADRDLFIGIFLLALMVLRMRKAMLVVMLTSIIMPVIDAILVITNAVDKTPSWIHIVTAVYGLVVGWMLYREEQHARIANTETTINTKTATIQTISSLEA